MLVTRCVKQLLKAMDLNLRLDQGSDNMLSKKLLGIVDQSNLKCSQLLVKIDLKTLSKMRVIFFFVIDLKRNKSQATFVLISALSIYSSRFYSEGKKAFNYCV